MFDNVYEKLIAYVIDSVISEGGDGDVTIICKSGNAEHLSKLCLDTLKKIYPKEVFNYNYREDLKAYQINTCTTQEDWTFTNDENWQYATTCKVYTY